MRVAITSTRDQAATIAANYIIERAKPGFRLGVATGSTPEGLYEELRAAYRDGRFSLEEATAWALDEYVGVDEDHPERYRNVLRAQLVGEDKTGLTDENLHTPDGLASDPEAAAAEYEAAIAPGVDVQICGIGANGHIGFNEPTGSFASRTHVGRLQAKTRQDNARFFDGDVDAVPALCITQGLATIMDAKAIVLLAFGAGKVDAVKNLVEGAVSAKWPATILQHHPEVLVVVDEEAAAGLELTDFYKEQWDA